VTNIKITTQQWKRILAFLETRSDLYIGKTINCKRFINAILWMTRSGAQWRLLPEKYGDWNSIYKRFNRWAEKGIWTAMFEHFANDADMESVMIDATIVRAHSSAGVKGGTQGGKPLDAVGVVSQQRYMLS
jgi:transposase